jgi:acetolactate synthase-1/2/3 large subunit
MNVSDKIFEFLKDKTDCVFVVVGGQAMYLNDALLRSGIRYICCHHEQACGMATDAYGRLTGKLGVALVTAGPGAVNVMNGVVGGYMDSSPMMVISGQSNLEYVNYQKKTGIRQHGIQGINIEPLVKSVTKYFKTIDDAKKTDKYLNKAYKLATEGRKGPTWIDCPLDIQKSV